MNHLKPHPVAALFPILTPESQAWLDLVDSIDALGQLDPIVIDGDVLLDGRNRHAACQQLKIKPKVVQWSEMDTGELTQAEWITAKNLDRRHLTDDQKATIAVEAQQWIAKEAAENKKASQFKKGKCPNPTGRGGKKQAHQKSGEPVSDPHRTRNAVAKAAGVSTYCADMALKLHNAAEKGEVPRELVEDAKAGIKTLREALKSVPKPQPKKASKRKETPLRDRVERKLATLINSFPDDQGEQVKAIILELIL